MLAWCQLPRGQRLLAAQRCCLRGEQLRHPGPFFNHCNLAVVATGLETGCLPDEGPTLRASQGVHPGIHLSHNKGYLFRVDMNKFDLATSCVKDLVELISTSDDCSTLCKVARLPLDRAPHTIAWPFAIPGLHEAVSPKHCWNRWTTCTMVLLRYWDTGLSLMKWMRASCGSSCFSMATRRPMKV